MAYDNMLLITLNAGEKRRVDFEARPENRLQHTQSNGDSAKLNATAKGSSESKIGEENESNPIANRLHSHSPYVASTLNIVKAQITGLFVVIFNR